MAFSQSRSNGGEQQTPLFCLEIWGLRQELVKAAAVEHSPSGNAILSNRNLVQEPVLIESRLEQN